MYCDPLDIFCFLQEHISINCLLPIWFACQLIKSFFMVGGRCCYAKSACTVYGMHTPGL